MIEMLPLLLIPLAVVGGAFFLRVTITTKEFVLAEVVVLPLLVGGFFIAKCGSMRSVEHLNGHITKKVSDTTSCCHCRSICDSKDKQGNCARSHEECDHSSDMSWSLETSMETPIVIETCDGSHSAPKAWTNAKVGEFAAVENGYTNYLKADSESLVLHGADEQLVEQIPDFPEIKDFYHVSKVVEDHAKAPATWQRELERLNDELGSSKQIDVTFLLTSHTDPDAYASAVEVAWLFGPKNALVIVLGTDGTRITWARVVTISHVERLKVEVRENLQGLVLMDPVIFKHLREDIKTHWTRTAMAEWEYLASHASPSTGWMIFLYLFAVAASVGVVLVAHHHDIFEDEGLAFRPRSRRR